MFKLNPIIMANVSYVSFTNKIMSRNEILYKYDITRWILPGVGVFVPAIMGDDGIIDCLESHDDLISYCVKNKTTVKTRGFIICPKHKRITKIVNTESGVFYDIFDVHRHDFICLTTWGDSESFLNTSLRLLAKGDYSKSSLMGNMNRVIDRNYVKPEDCKQEKISWQLLSKLCSKEPVSVRKYNNVWKEMF